MCPDARFGSGEVLFGIVRGKILAVVISCRLVATASDRLRPRRTHFERVWRRAARGAELLARTVPISQGRPTAAPPQMRARALQHQTCAMQGSISRRPRRHPLRQLSWETAQPMIPRQLCDGIAHTLWEALDEESDADWQI